MDVDILECHVNVVVFVASEAEARELVGGENYAIPGRSAIAGQAACSDTWYVRAHECLRRLQTEETR